MKQIWAYQRLFSDDILTLGSYIASVDGKTVSGRSMGIWSLSRPRQGLRMLRSQQLPNFRPTDRSRLHLKSPQLGLVVSGTIHGLATVSSVSKGNQPVLGHHSQVFNRWANCSQRSQNINSNERLILAHHNII